MRNEILDYFRKANGEFVSGEQISKDLHVSRTAIWKHIKVLKERGYIFESSTRKGYRLIYAPNLLTPLEIDSALHTETFGRHVVYMSSTRSTNEEAKKIAREGAEEGTIVVAEEQTGGHGRLPADSTALCQGHLVFPYSSSEVLPHGSIQMYSSGCHRRMPGHPTSGTEGCRYQMAE